MPLLDHFHEPIYPLHPWESFHAFWASSIGSQLNRVLPPRYFAAIHSHLGSRVEADIAEFEDKSAPDTTAYNAAAGGLALGTVAAPVATATMSLVFPDDLEVQVVDTRDGATLAGVIELVSPGNLDRPETRRAFAAKCAAYLQRGIGLIGIDIVTCHHFNLHNELIDLLHLPVPLCMASDVFLYAVSYRPVHRHDVNQADFWPVPLGLTQSLPSLPLALKAGPVISVDLEATYTEARQHSRL